MGKKERIWIRVDGKSVVDHKIDAKKLAEILSNFQEMVYRIKPRWSRNSDYTVYVDKIEKGSTQIGIDHRSDSQNLHNTYGIVNDLVLGVNDATSSEELGKCLNAENNEGLVSELLRHTGKFWSNSDDEISIYYAEDPNDDKKEAIILKPEKKALFEKLDIELHTPIRTHKYGVLTALNSDLKHFELKTSEHKIKGNYDKLLPEVQKELKEYFEKPVKIHGKYDRIKKEFLEIYSISHSTDVEMDVFGPCELPESVNRAVDELLNGFENLMKQTGTLYTYLSSPNKELIDAIEKLEGTLDFEYCAEKREDAVWDYNGVLMLFLKKYTPNDTNPALKELMNIFNEYLYYILLPIPEKIKNGEITEYGLGTYDPIMDGYIAKLDMELRALKKKYAHMLPTYQELRDEAGIIELDDELKEEIKKIL
ncbi:hypothetical protein [Methanococcus maripaludis]|uniref:Uncharacterized protein n=1 Tax=Methanococcus maripaludis TaxID=39152 RepID=A0A7J9PW46_METMI|nr:hypothetical protein [Methanococcus maripaludis]MBA2868880.1 hypothetical protein [Methanococcus maripaludis]